MRVGGFSEPQVLAILREVEGWVSVPELCWEHEMSTWSF